MKRVTPIREPQPNVLEAVEDPKHRLDVATYRFLGELASRDPVLDAIYSNVKGPLAEFLNKKLGPENYTPVKIKQKQRRRSRKNPNAAELRERFGQ